MTKKQTGLLLPLLIAAMLLFSGCTAAREPSASPASSGVADQSAVFDGAGNTPANLLHDGVAAEYDGYVYHTDKMMAGSIWRTPAGGGDSELIKQGTFHSLNISGGVIFAVGYLPNPENDLLEIEGIVRMNTDGSDAQMIKEGYFDSLTLYDNYLYYIDPCEGCLYRMKTDGSDEKQLLEGLYGNYAVTDGVIYALAELDESYNDNIYKLPLSGGTPELIFQRTFGNYIDVALGGIFFIPAGDTEGNTYRYDIGTGQSEVFCEGWIDYVNTDGEYLYYFWSGVRMDNADAGVYRINSDGSNSILLLQIEECYSINIAGDMIFFHTNDDERRLSVMNTDGSGLKFLPQAED